MDAGSKFRYTAIGLVLFIFTYFTLQYNRKTDIDNYLHQKTIQYTQEYSSIYKSYKRLSEVIFKTDINTLEVQNLFHKRDRKELYDYLYSTYKVLKKYNIKQLQFHLPNNHSFLRFNTPSRYGDDLTNIRQTVRYVNKERKPIDGIEAGRVYSGYRFVFPMYYEKKYIGSVETSFSTFAFTIEFSKMHHIPCNFFIAKDAIDKKIFKSEKSNYISSPFKNFYREAKTTTYIGKHFHAKIHTEVSSHTKQLINSLGEQNSSFSVYDSVRDRILTIIKVKNPITKKVIGLFIAGSDAKFIHKQNLTFEISLIILFFSIAAILFFLYKNNRYKESLSNINQTLENRIQSEVDKNRQKDHQIIQQSRLAQMGEMMSMIAHQWRQPLAAISSTSVSINLKAQLSKLDNNSAIELTNKISQYAQHLSSTIDDFRDFFKPNKEKKEIRYDYIITSVLNIVEASIANKNIKLVKNLQSKDVFVTYPNELKQVVLNLLKNAEDILIEKKIQNPIITIQTKDEILTISDNGGGIPEDIIDKIFNPYFSTKTKKDGTGLGLYMSKIIIEEHCKGKLSAINDQNGAVFTIQLGKNSE